MLWFYGLMAFSFLFYHWSRWRDRRREAREAAEWRDYIARCVYESHVGSRLE